MNLVSSWESIQQKLREKIGDTSYETWFTAIRVKEKTPQTLLIETPDEFFKNWIVEHYHDFIEDFMNHNVSEHIAVDYIVNNQILKEDTQIRFTQFEKNFKKPYQRPFNINSRFTFENFVIGPSNRFACAASLAVAESPSKAYNPLLIYGRVGLGKTHLIQSITHKIKALHPKLKIQFMTSELFTNELIDAIRHRSTDQFRRKYREIDVLLIDDIHFIAGKESTQEEFFHTFNYLHNNRKQIIITSDRPPREIAKLEERLSSRFAWGLITDIQPPNFETRVAILKKKIEHEPVSVPDDVMIFIAEEIKTNIRELEGALIRVVAYSLMEEKPVTLEMAKAILKDMVKETMQTISMEMVQKSVAGYYKISLAELRNRSRTKNIVLPRQIAMYLARRLTNLSLPEIGNAFGGKDHTTVMHACKKIERELQQQVDIKDTVEQLSTSLKQ